MYLRFNFSYNIVKTLLSTRKVTAEIHSQLQLHDVLCIDFFLIWLNYQLICLKPKPGMRHISHLTRDLAIDIEATAALWQQLNLSDLSPVHITHPSCWFPRGKCSSIDVNFHWSLWPIREVCGKKNRVATASSCSEKPKEGREEEVTEWWGVTNAAFPQKQMVLWRLKNSDLDFRPFFFFFILNQLWQEGGRKVKTSQLSWVGPPRRRFGPIGFPMTNTVGLFYQRDTWERLHEVLQASSVQCNNYIIQVIQ